MNELKQMHPDKGEFRVAYLDHYGTWSWEDVFTRDAAVRLIKMFRNGADKVFIFNRKGACVYQA